jgi:6-phosphogluconate dehydrogenase
MKIGMIGLGKMGANMTLRLLRGGHQVVVTDVNLQAVDSAVQKGAVGAVDVEEMIDLLERPRIIWAMVPSGDATEKTVQRLAEMLDPGDIVIDGGNSNYNDSIRRAASLKTKGIHFIDVGTSGGIWGLSEGYSMMIGGEQPIVDCIRPILETLAPAADIGWGHVGPSGAGHFVKMVHNGIEYGLMQAYAEGFELMKHKHAMNLDLHQIAEIWRHGSVIRSWLLDLTANALQDNPELKGIAAYVPDSGEGRWTVVESITLGVPIPVISLALQRRFRSQNESPFSDKLLAAMRNQFGGHTIKRAE